MNQTPRMLRNSKLARRAAAESMVLLKNVQNTLPLRMENGEKLPIAVLGVGQVHTVRGGTGSGEVNCAKAINILDGLCASEQVEPDGLMARRYRNWALANPAKLEYVGLATTQHCYPEMPVSQVDIDGLAERCRAAVVVITRIAGEGGDMAYEKGTLCLTDDETTLIDRVSAAFTRWVLVLNVPGFLEIAEIASKVPAILFAGLPGQEAGPAVADVLTGRVQPSGKLADTWPLRYAQFPTQDFGATTPNADDPDQKDVIYRDDLYVGYRYFDTFGEDVLYPFGYGLTYGKAEMTAVSFGQDGRELSLDVTVANTGSTFPVREVVQVYASVPGDRLAQPYQRLAAFAKTHELAPGEAQQLHLTFPITDLASYDEASSCWVLPAGDYFLRVGFSSRATMIAGCIRIARETRVRQCRKLFDAPEFDRMTPSGVKPISYADEADELARARRGAIRLPDRTVRAEKVKYRTGYPNCRRAEEPFSFDDARDGICNVSRIVAQMQSETLCELACGCGMDVDAFPEEMRDAIREMPEFSAMIGNHAQHLAGAAGETLELEEYGVPYLTLADGPAGLRLERDLTNEDGKVIGHQYCTAFPTGSLLASAFDPELLEEIGKAVAVEMKEYGVHIWLAPALNLHRNPLGGRSFEYFSEDPLVSGRCAAAITRGVQSMGRAVTLKHFAVNSQENDRTISSSQISERALRELYLKGFEIAVRESAPMAMMTAYNAINGVPCSNNRDLCTAVARDEFGFRGVIMTDWGGGRSEPALSMWAGNDLIMPGGTGTVAQLKQALNAEPVANRGSSAFAEKLTRGMLEQSAINILNLVCRLTK